MRIIDVNVLVYAFRSDSLEHAGYSQWLGRQLRGDEPIGVADAVLSSFIRLVTHPRIFRTPTPLDAALQFADSIREAPGSLTVAPGERHWNIFTSLCRQAGARGNLVPDAYLAALAIESGAELATADGDFARFPGLRWKHPLAM